MPDPKPFSDLTDGLYDCSPESRERVAEKVARSGAYVPPTNYPKLRLMAEAACYEADNEIVAVLAEIDRLRAENAALREAGSRLVRCCNCDVSAFPGGGHPHFVHERHCPLTQWEAALNAPYEHPGEES